MAWAPLRILVFFGIGGEREGEEGVAIFEDEAVIDRLFFTWVERNVMLQYTGNEELQT